MDMAVNSRRSRHRERDQAIDLLRISAFIRCSTGADGDPTLSRNDINLSKLDIDTMRDPASTRIRTLWRGSYRLSPSISNASYLIKIGYKTSYNSGYNENRRTIEMIDIIEKFMVISAPFARYKFTECLKMHIPVETIDRDGFFVGSSDHNPEPLHTPPHINWTALSHPPQGYGEGRQLAHGCAGLQSFIAKPGPSPEGYAYSSSGCISGIMCPARASCRIKPSRGSQGLFQGRAASTRVVSR